MTTYLVSIAPEPDTGAHFSIRVEATGGATRLVEMTFRSSSPGGLSLSGLPQLDLAAVGRALIAAAGATADEATEPERPGESVSADRPRRQRTRRTERAYRRMPDVDELMSVFAEVGSVTKLAERYGVPRHTAQGWMGRARKQSE